MILGEKWPLLVRSRGRRPYSGPLRSRSSNPVYWHEDGGGALPGFPGELRFRLVGMWGAAAGDHEGNLALTASDSPAEHRHVAVSRAWVCHFDLHGWSTSAMNVQASTCDGLLAPYKHASSVLFSKPMPATRPTGSQTGPPERKAPDQQRR